MADVSALYPQAPAPGPLSDPTKVLGLLPVLSQMAIGQQYQKALNPDGTLDYNALASGIKSSPAAAYAAPAATSTMLAQHGQEIANSTAAFGLASSQNKFLIDGLGSLAAKPDVNDADIHNFVVTAARNTNIPSSILTGWMNSLPKNDPVALHKALITMQNISMGANAASTPTQVGITDRNSPAGPGAPIVGTRGQFNYGAQGPAAIQPPAGVVTALGPQAQAAAGTYGAQAGAAAGTAATNEVDYRRQVTPLEQAIPALERLGTAGTGPGKDEINTFKSAAVAFGFAPDKWTGTVKDFDEAKKYLTDWVRANGDISTNDKLAASFSSNPSVSISNAAAQDVAKTALALRRMKYMQLQQFYQTGQSPDQFPQWASQWNARHDPRAFGFDQMSPAQRNSVLKSLPVAKRVQFKLDVQAADEAGVLTRQ